MLMNFAGVEGYLTDDVHLNHTKKGTLVTTFDLAIDGPKQKNGSQYTDYPTVTLWGKQAKILHDNAGKGSLISITGYNHTRHYQNKRGETVYVQEIMARNMQMLKTKQPNQQIPDKQVTSKAPFDKANSKSVYTKADRQATIKENEHINKILKKDHDLPF